MPHPTRRLLPRLALAAAIAALPLAAACSSATGALNDGPVQVVELDRPFSIAVGQTVALHDSVSGAPLRVTFLGVTDDSRCPENATCVWEGDARVRLRLQSASAAVDTAAHTSPRMTPPPEVAGFRVVVDGLVPNARTDRPVVPGAYVATLRVTRR